MCKRCRLIEKIEAESGPARLFAAGGCYLWERRFGHLPEGLERETAVIEGPTAVDEILDFIYGLNYEELKILRKVARAVEVERFH